LIIFVDPLLDGVRGVIAVLEPSGDETPQVHLEQCVQGVVGEGGLAGVPNARSAGDDESHGGSAGRVLRRLQHLRPLVTVAHLVETVDQD
jgi:hypothetical protein